MDFHLVPGDGRRNYTGFVTKTIVYGLTLLLLLVGKLICVYVLLAIPFILTYIIFFSASALTLASILVPRWLSYHSETVRHVTPLRILASAVLKFTAVSFSFRLILY